MEILRINHFCNTVFCNIGASIIFFKKVYYRFTLKYRDSRITALFLSQPALQDTAFKTDFLDKITKIWIFIIHHFVYWRRRNIF
jgi:hypothetical protein